MSAMYYVCVCLLVDGLSRPPLDVGDVSGLEPLFPCSVRVGHEVGLDAVHDLGELELQADLQQGRVLADGVGDAGLHTVAAISHLMACILKNT